LKLAEAVGMKPRSFGKLAKIYELAKGNENAKAKLDKVDKGERSIDAAYKSLRTLIKDPSDDATEIPEFVRCYHSRQFSANDPRFGIPHPGRIPGQISANIIDDVTGPGDLVVDPMAGGGSTLDAASYLGRECLGYDVAPRRPDIIQHDIREGFPQEAKDAALIFMDPPYWNMKDEGYTDESASRLALEEFETFYAKLMRDAAKTVCLGGFVAVINMAQYFRLPENFPAGYIDWPIKTYHYLLDACMTPWSRISVTYPTSLFTGFDVEAAKKGKFLLPNHGDIIVMRRTK
jgi:DNA modification methylase